MPNTILDPSTTLASLNESLSLDDRLVKALKHRLGISRPTLVQAQVWPLTLNEGRSCLVRAPTGSGKTLAYLVPLVQKLLSEEESTGNEKNRALILVPTRELCHQVGKVLSKLTHYCGSGGSNYQANTATSAAILSVGQARNSQQKEEQARQWAALRDDPSIVIGTPAGIAHAMRQTTNNSNWPSQIRTVVIDEADLVLSLGYEPDLRQIVQSLPRLYQGMIVSATLNAQVQALKGWVLLDEPVVVQVEDDAPTVTPKLKQLYLPVKSADKYLVLYVFLKLGLLQGKGLFFVKSTDAGYRLKLFLQLFSIRAAVLNAELPVASRLHIIEQFHLGNMDYLIATDSSTDGDHGSDDDDDDDNKNKSKRSDSEYGVSRGVDFHRVSFVVNVDFPPNPTVYRHRIGRTARGGRAGVALSLVSTDPPPKPQKNKKLAKQPPPPPSDWELLQAVQEDQPRIPQVQAAAQKHTVMQGAPRTQDGEGMNDDETDQAQPVLLDFDLHEIEGFRYRVEDVSRAVTRKAVQQARTDELKMEIMNSERLQQHFAANPADAKLLQHDRPTSVLQAQDHLKHVPKYLLPKGMQVADLHKKRKRKKKKMLPSDRASKDPLQSFQADVNLDGVAGADEDENDDYEDEAVGMNDEDEGPASKRPKLTETRVFANTRDGTGKSTSGRNAWKERHRKGKFSNKKRKSEKRSQPLGI